MRHKPQLYDELDTKAIRLIDPNAGAFISAYKPLVDFARNQGVDTFIATGFYRRNNYSMTTLGEKVAAAVRAGIPLLMSAVKTSQMEMSRMKLSWQICQAT